MRVAVVAPLAAQSVGWSVLGVKRGLMTFQFILLLRLVIITVAEQMPPFCPGFYSRNLSAEQHKSPPVVVYQPSCERFCLPYAVALGETPHHKQFE